MSKVIYKYEIVDGGTTQMPSGAEILSVGVQRDAIVAWAIVNTSAQLVVRKLIVVGTGQSPPEGTFIGTVGPVMGWMWFHIFDCGGETP